jgi:serine/threonine-protein kinase
MGSVWAARDEAAGARAALKILHEHLELRPDARQRLRREAVAAGRILHPGIVTVQEVLEFDGSLVLVMDLLTGETLRSRLDRESRRDPKTSAALLAPVATVLRVAHWAGVTHRDLKPENVFVVAAPASDPTSVKVLDFGVAKVLDPPPDDGSPPLATGLGTVLGTLAYMAPEQVTGASLVAGSADTWALGVMLYEALVGFRPIEGSSRNEVIHRLLTDAIVPIAALAPDVPPGLGRLVGRMLSRAPERRPSDEEVETTLAHFASG